MIKQNNIIKPNTKNDEIDLIALAKITWNGRKTIIIIVLLFFVIGLTLALISPKQYKATTVMVTQSNNGQNRGGLTSLAAMAGINLNMNSSGNELSPAIYPQIVQSIPFQKELMHVRLNFEDYQEKISLYDYYTNPKYAKFNFLRFVKNSIIGTFRSEAEEIKDFDGTDSNIILLSSKERALTNILSNYVSLKIDPNEGNITLTSIMPEAKAAAQLGEEAQILLQQKVTQFKIAKSNMQLKFVQERFNEKKLEFEKAQTKLALFNDRNKNVTTAIAKTEEERLRNEYQLIFSVYSELAKQLESSRIQVKNQTPVFSIIEPIVIPANSYKPNRIQILFTWFFIGLTIGIGMVLGRFYFTEIKQRWENK